MTGATGFAVYRSTAPGVTPANYAGLPGGTRTLVPTSPHAAGPLATGTTYYFVVSALIGTLEGPASSEVSSTTGLPAVTAIPRQGTILPIAGILRDVAFDAARNRVYASNETAGTIEILDVGAAALLPPVAIGSLPSGIDLSPEQSVLWVCLRGSAQIARLDLSTDPPVPLAPVPVPVDASGASNPRWIACASNNRAFFSCENAGAGYTLLRQLDLATLAVTVRTEINGGQTLDPTYIAASYDRSRLAFVHGVSGGSFYHYTVAGDAFAGPRALPSGNIVSGVTLNGDGSLIGFSPDCTLAGPDLRLRGSVVLASSRLVLPPTGNRFFCAASGQVFQSLYPDYLQRLDPIVLPLGSGSPLAAKLDPSGTTLYAATNTGLLSVPLTVNRPPFFVDGGPFTVSAGETASVTFRAIDLDGDPVDYCADGLPANASFDPATRRLTFSPSVAQAGQTYTTPVIYASDGRNARFFNPNLYAINPASYPRCELPVGGSGLSTLGELAFDPLRNRLYIASWLRQCIDVMDVPTHTLLDPIRVGGTPVGIDLSLDASKLVVCTNLAEYIRVVDLTASPPAVASIPVPDGTTPDSRLPFTVGVTAAGHALFTTYSPSAASPVYVRDLNLGTNAVSIRGDVPGGTVTYPALVRSSRDRSKLIFTQSQVSPYPLFTHSSGTDSFSPIVTRAILLRDADVNADGTRYLVAAGAELYDAGLSSLGTFPAASDYSVAFRQGTSTGYRYGLGSPNIEILNLTTFASGGTFVAGASPQGRMITDDAGTRLFLVRQNGFSVVRLP